MNHVEGLRSLENHVGNPPCLVPVVLAVENKILSSPKHLPHYMAFVTALIIKMQICIFLFEYSKCTSKTMQVCNRFRYMFEDSGLVSISLPFF